MNVQVFGDIAEAVKVGTIEGDVYDSDQEVWADEESLAKYLAEHPEIEKPGMANTQFAA